MGELFGQLGVDWKLLLSQGVNFLIVCGVLTALAYKPLLRIMKERREKIEFGLKNAEEASELLKETERIKEEKLAEAGKEAVTIISDAETTAKKRTSEMLAAADKKADSLLQDAHVLIERKKKEELERVCEEARGLIKEALIKTVELDPSQIDDALIREALEDLRKTAKA